MINLDELLELEAKASDHSNIRLYANAGWWENMTEQDADLFIAMRNNIKELCLRLKAAQRVLTIARSMSDTQRKWIEEHKGATYRHNMQVELIGKLLDKYDEVSVMPKVDLDELNRLYGPWKKAPVSFVDYPDINKLLDAYPAMMAELAAARAVCESLEKSREEEYCNVPDYVDKAMDKYKKVRGEK